MSLIQIEKGLLSMNQSRFQKLCAEYLSYKYPNDKVKEIGGSYGQETTTTGTPDVRIDLDNKKYIFAECTIQKKGLLKKFKGDIENCFEESKSGIKVDDINLIYLCHNTKTIKETEKRELEQICNNKNCGLDFIDIDDLKHDIFQQYRILAKEFLNIEVDTLQILPVKDFISENQKKATSLENQFFEREAELKKISEYLKTENLIIITGKAGVGKTRFVLQAFQEFKEKNQEYEIIGIHNKGISLYNDLQTHFLPTKKYLLLVDDANRLNEFSHIARLTTEYQIKIVITVRDYAIDKIRNQLYLEEYTYSTIELNKLKDETIKEILHSLKITNSICVDNITRIADGNSRLVLMSVNFVLQTDNCHRLRNVTDIYDSYFAKSINELSELNDDNLLKTLGIVCFFRVIDRDNKEQNENIYQVFKINENVFWENILKLHEMEFIDLHEDKTILKISDQVLSTYFFYFVFIKKSLINYSVILENFLEDFTGKIKENLYPVLSHFGYEQIMKKLEPAIDEVFIRVKEADSQLIKFYKVFWFNKKTELLIWIKEKIDKLPENKQGDFKFIEEKETPWNIENYPYIKLLKLFGHHPDSNFKLSIELIFEYGIKDPAIISEIIKYCKSELSINRDSYNNSYYFQRELFSVIFQKIKEKKNDNFYKGFLISIAGHFLKLWYDDTRMTRDNKAFSISQVHIIDNPVIKNLRSEIWSFLYSNYEKNGQIFSILCDYISNSYTSVFSNEERNNPNPHTQKIREFDEPFVIRFFENKLKPNEFKNSILFFEYIDQLEYNKVDTLKYKQLISKYSSKIYKTYLALTFDYSVISDKNHELGWKESEEIRKQEIINYCKGYTFEKYCELLEIIIKIHSTNKNKQTNSNYNLFHSIEIILVNLFSTQTDLGFQVVEYILSKQNSLKFTSFYLMNTVVSNSQEAENKLYSIINKSDFYNKNEWLIHFLSAIPKERITEQYLNELLDIYRAIESRTYLRFSHLDNYKKLMPNIWISVIKLLLDRTENSEFILNTYFEQFFKDYIHELDDDLPLLKRLYFYAVSNANHFDYNKDAFKIILSKDEGFLIEYMSFIKTDNYIPTRHDINGKFDFIWQLKIYSEILNKAIEFVVSQKYYYGSNKFANVFFPVNLYNGLIENFITIFIKNNYSDKRKMQLIFNVISHTYPKKRVEHIRQLVKYNTDKVFLEKLPLIPNTRTTNSTFVPHYEADKKFWKELEAIFSSDLKLLHLKKWAKQEQKYCDNNIKYELKRTFRNEY